MIIESPEEAERIVTQVVENIQRAELTEADEADAYHQLSLIGVSAAAIAKKAGRTKTAVVSALKAKASEAGAAALGKGYTIDEALIMADFEGDHDATEELETVIADEPDQLLHVAQMLRDRRDRAAALAALIAGWAAGSSDDHSVARVQVDPVVVIEQAGLGSGECCVHRLGGCIHGVPSCVVDAFAPRCRHIRMGRGGH
jgi:hypothetical protein